jgi:ABC-type multidrug transport system ATPase subunit
MVSREPNKLKAERVEAMLASLNLLTCADSRIGNEIIRGISGGEKRRLSLALEILTEPKIIFLDEPTSGLDSFSALLVISVLKQVAA